MKSRFLMSLVLGLTVVACTSTEGEAELNEGVETAAGGGQEGAAEAAKPTEAGAEAEKAAAETGLDSKAEASASETAAPAAEAPASEAPGAEAAATEAAPASIEAAVAEASAAGGQQVYPTTSLLNLRTGPGTKHSVARKARFGEAISLSGETKGKWLQTTDGLWVSKAFTSASKPSQYSDPVLSAPVVSEPATTSAPAQEEAAPAAEAPAAL